MQSVIVCRDAAMGDVLVAAAVAPALKKKHPGCQLFFATHCPEVLRNNPWVDNLWAGQAQQIEAVYDLNLVSEMRPYTHMLTAYAEAVGVPQAECRTYLYAEDPPFELPGGYVVMHPGTSWWVGRHWNRWPELAHRLARVGLSVVVVGDQNGLVIPHAIDLRGRTSLPQLAGVIRNARAFAGVDSFPMHVAQVFHIPGVAFFGSILPEYRLMTRELKAVTAVGLSCLGCYHRRPPPCTFTSICERGTEECVSRVTVDQMERELFAILQRS